MLDRVMIHCPGMIDGKQDFDRTFRTMLYSDREQLVVSAQAFSGLSYLLGPADLYAPFEYPSVTDTLTPQMLKSGHRS